MANEQNQKPAASAAPSAAPAVVPTNFNMEQLFAMFAASQKQLADSQAQIAALMERQTEFNEKNAIRRKKTMEEYLKERPRKRLLHQVFQNGREVNPAGLSWDTIRLLDTLATGTYGEGIVDVVRIKDGLNGVNSRIHISYNNKHEAQRMQFNMRYPTFTKLVQDIAAEMKVLGIEPVNDAVADPIEEIVEVAPRESVKQKQ
jgi:hypothetical protein